MGTVLVTGGAGYIGSHTTVALLAAGHQVVVLDNLSNSAMAAIHRIEQISQRSIVFYRGDILDRACLDLVFANHPIEAVLHFAGLKAVAESVSDPLRYFDNNVVGTLVLCQAMAKAGIWQLVFSSSATVYGDPQRLPIQEIDPVGATTNAYGTSKYLVERILQDIQHSDPRWCITILRYFNPVGAHPSGLLGEAPHATPNNLMPLINQVAQGLRPYLSIYGHDYPTLDGTGIRDYIHVQDLAAGHLQALLTLGEHSKLAYYNLGTGVGYSVLEVIDAFERCSNQSVPYILAPRRIGDVASCFADVALAQRELGWSAKHGLEEMLRDSWRWQQANPKGYDDAN